MKRNIVESYSIEEAFRALNKKPSKKVVEAVDTTKSVLPKVPAPYDKYFEVIDPAEIEFDDGMFQIGELIDDATILAYLAAKGEYLDRFDSDAFLIDDEVCPVVEIIGDRCYPIDVEEIFGEAKKVIEAADTDPYTDYIFISGVEFHGGHGGDAFEYYGFKKDDNGWTFTCNDGEDTIHGPYPSIYECIMSALDGYMSPEDVEKYNNSIECDDMRFFVEASPALAAELSDQEIASIKAFMSKYDKLPSVESAEFMINDELPY